MKNIKIIIANKEVSRLRDLAAKDKGDLKPSVDLNVLVLSGENYFDVIFKANASAKGGRDIKNYSWSIKRPGGNNEEWNPTGLDPENTFIRKGEKDYWWKDIEGTVSEWSYDFKPGWPSGTYRVGIIVTDTEGAWVVMQG